MKASRGLVWALGLALVGVLLAIWNRRKPPAPETGLWLWRSGLFWGTLHEDAGWLGVWVRRPYGTIFYGGAP